MTNFAFLPITQLSRLIDSGELDPSALTRLFLDRTDGVGCALNSYIARCPDAALREAAAAAERAAAKRRLGPLDGVPIAIKDNIDVQGVPTSNGFGGPPYRVPAQDAEVVRRLRAAGAVVLGKLNMHEGALGSTNDNPHFGRAINPHHAGFTPGGSSGGAGAAVAAGLCCAALGTDTGGSVRIPASYCGVVGLKPSYGLVSTRGVVPLSHRLDHVGPLTRNVADAALLLGVLGGFDPECPESRHGAGDTYEKIPDHGRLDGLTLGVLRNIDAEPPEPAIAAAFRAALDQLTQLGTAIHLVELPSYDMARGRRAGFLRVEVEAASLHGELYRRAPERFSPEMRYYLDFGGMVPATRLVGADRHIAIAAFELAQCFELVDAIVTPTTPQAAFPFGRKAPDNAGSYTILANFAGCPAISVPMGRNALGLPLGLQVIGPDRKDGLVLRIAAAYEAVGGWRIAPPSPFGPSPDEPPREPTRI